MNVPDDDLLWLFLDGELGARQHALVEKTLAQDPAWMKRFEELRAMDQVMRAGLDEDKLAERAHRIADGVLREISTEKQTPPGSENEPPDPDPV